MLTKPGQIQNIIEGFEDWKLDDPNPGRQEFFSTVMSALENNESGFASFAIGIPMEKGVGGYYTERLGQDQINLPDIAEMDWDTLTFRFHGEKVSDQDDPIDKEMAFAIFVHEACHFLHLSRDGGEFTSPNMVGEIMDMDGIVTSTKLRREAEFEAGYRSVKYNAMFQLFPEGDRTILDMNLRNMLNYDIPSQSKEWMEEYDRITKQWCEPKSSKIAKGHQQDFRDFQNGLIARVQRFTEWTDPKHEIKGVLNH